MQDKFLSEESIEKYSRHILLPEIGGVGQIKLRQKSVFVVGVGGLGSAVLIYLAASGIGKLGLADGDFVEISNLPRQIIHLKTDLRKNKALSAQEKLKKINPDAELEIITNNINNDNIDKIIGDYDLVVDASDNFSTKFLLADYCWRTKKPFISAGVLRFEGQLMVVMPGENYPCYRCFLAEPPPDNLTTNCQRAGVFGPLVGVMGTIQAVEAIKVLLNIGKILKDKVLLYNALSGEFTYLKRTKNPDCSFCLN